MPLLRRLLPVILVGLLGTCFLLLVFRNVPWRALPLAAGLGKFGPSEGDSVLPDLRHGQATTAHAVSSENRTNPYPAAKVYPVGKTKPPGSRYTRALVVAKLQIEDTEWIEVELGDLIASGILSPRVYTVDNHEAELHVAKNKGHEVMVYLTYIIDNYEKLPDVSIFTHAHQFAWHNNEVLDEDMAQMVRHLSPERVTREGYMNLRCHWEPGCPDWLHPGVTEVDFEKKEEVIIADKWIEVYPKDPIPNVLAQPCCAQFAVSRERIQSIPKQRFVTLRDWITRTDLTDYMSGRVFEYTWQFIFTASPVYCPSQAACYCDGYGLCFGSDAALTDWLTASGTLNDLVDQLRRWDSQVDDLERLRKHSSDGRIAEDALVQIPEVGKDRLLEAQIREVKKELRDKRSAAFERGKDPKQRALEAGRPWKNGDGF